MNLAGITETERRELPSWLVRLLDSDDTYEIGHALRHCGDRLYRKLLAQRLAELKQQ